MKHLPLAIRYALVALAAAALSCLPAAWYGIDVGGSTLSYGLFAAPPLPDRAAARVTTQLFAVLAALFCVGAAICVFPVAHGKTPKWAYAAATGGGAIAATLLQLILSAEWINAFRDTLGAPRLLGSALVFTVAGLAAGICAIAHAYFSYRAAHAPAAEPEDPTDAADEGLLP